MKTYDAVIVGARCAGSIVAGRLAEEGWNVLLVDKAEFPSDTVSTHCIFPNTIARFAELGILERLRDRHDLPSLYFSWGILGYMLEGTFTPIDGHETATSIRRITLDHDLNEWARDKGAQTRFGVRVTGLLRSGDDGPVHGVELDNGEEVQARWTIGADGRASTIAGALGLEKENPMSGDLAFLFAYWRGLPRGEKVSLLVNDQQTGFMRNPSEDGVDLLSVAGSSEMTRGSLADREREYARRLSAFPEEFDASLLDNAERISDLVVVPETMMRGFFRQANGPGWVLVGDSGHFKHPATAQGISDAVEQAIYVADALAGDDPDLATYADWRQARARGHYSWSFTYGTWPASRSSSSHTWQRSALTPRQLRIGWTRSPG